MHNFFSKQSLGLILAAVLVWSSAADARCYRGPDWTNRGSDGNASGMGITAINIMSNYLQPMGSVIAASTVVPSQSFSGGQAGSPDDVLYYCETQEDVDNFRVTFATNGDNRYSGEFEVPEYPGAYYTLWHNVAFRATLTETGQVVNRLYQEFPAKPIYNPDTDRYEFYFRQLSPLAVELIKVPGRPPGGIWDTDGQAYTYTQPFVYYVFSMPGVNANGPVAGDDSRVMYRGFSNEFVGFGIYRNPRATIYRRAGCVVRNNTPFVLFPTVSVAELESGAAPSSPIRVDVECDTGVASGTNAGQTAFGLQVSQASYFNTQLHESDLINGYGGVSYLLSDDYGVDANVARGVGIRLEHMATGERMNFLGWHGVNCVGTAPEVCGENPTGGGRLAGWYPVLAGAEVTEISDFGTTKYSHQMSATLEKLPNSTVTPGKVKARAQVLVRVQ
ncbi:fimbrial protein [Marinobacter shengliensis]|uniref:fimbrial protein n=1 Tax=Marinobacter shengliensis TaxID=1389223 RepID=UPI0011B1C820|nr:fimbrial protein [Marinobacter shengliensis]